MRTITNILDKANKATLTASDLASNLTESEGKKGSIHVNSTGHALQHISVLKGTDDGSFAELKTAYHKRGPAKFHGTTGDVVSQGGPQSHSQFKNEDHACELIARALMTKGGLEALQKLKDPKHTIKLEVGFAPGMHAVKRTAHVVQKDAQNRGAFVLIDPMELSGVVLELHQSNSTPGGLHFQSAYPTNSGGPAAGTEKMTVTTHADGAKSSQEFQFT